MQLLRKNILAAKIIIIDGLSGSGKSLIAPFFSSFKQSELCRYNQLYEEVIFLLDNKKIDLNAAKILLSTHADLDLYNLIIGRDINFRASDDSSAQKNLLSFEYKRRSKLLNFDNLTKKYINKKVPLLLMTHHILPHAKLISKVFSDRELFFISLSRYPATIIKNYLEAGWENRFNYDPREFTLTIDKNGKNYPIFFKDDIIKKYSYSEIVVNHVLDYIDFQKKYLRKNHIVINFESFEKNPDHYFSKLEPVLGRKTEITNRLMKMNKIPRSPKDNRTKHLNIVLSLIHNVKLKTRLISACDKYFDIENNDK